MKTKFIAGVGGTIFGLTILPFTGVFAVEYGEGLTDTVRVMVGENCQIEADVDGTEVVWQAGMAGSAYAPKNGTPMTISCNTTNGWTLKATASDLVNVANTARKIPFGAYGTDGGSVWSAAISVVGGNANNYAIENSWGDFGAVEANNTTVLSGTNAGIITVTPQYKAFVAEGEAAGYYEGTIYYTFAESN